jgi:uncharacterized membrane protein SpoIIM required for sporulation
MTQKKKKFRMSLSVVSGVLLILCGILEGFDTYLENFTDFKFEGHHSMFILAGIHFVYALADFLEGTVTMKH